MFKKANTSRTVTKMTSEAMNDIQKSSTENKQSRVLLILAVVLIGLTYHKVDGLEKKQTTIIVPYGAKSGDLLVSGESASLGYVRMLARLIINDWGSVSKASVDDKFSQLLGLVYIDRVEAMRQKLNERAKYFKQFNTVSQSMEIMNDQIFTITENPAGIQYNTSAKNKFRLELSVEQRKLIGEQVKPSETLKMKIDYTVADGQFWILDIQE
ncbi:hypothetical protein EXT65_21215 [Pectobacterium carotovorum subsp. carotovorum]|nr:type IV conjugative transfer system protein TraE [Pectobacterium carotovorum]MCL6336316.1 hypothetical protein [Pectobacterium carotovorum subsp. carotovorum]